MVAIIGIAPMRSCRWPNSIVRLAQHQHKREQMIHLVMEMHGKKFKVFAVDSSKHDGQNKRLVGTFKTSDQALAFMQTYPC